MELGYTHLTLGWGSFALETSSKAAGSTQEEEDWIVKAWKAPEQFVAFEGGELIGLGVAHRVREGWRRE